MDLKELQGRLWDWQVKNFGAEEPFWLALGIVEEVGELCHHLLKRHQGIRGEGDRKAEIADAIGDIGIYALNLGSRNGCAFHLQAGLRPGFIPGFVSAKSVGELSALASEILNYQIEGKNSWQQFEKLFGLLGWIAAEEDISFYDLLEETAEKVMKRDWTKDRLNGGDNSQPCFKETGYPEEETHS